MPFTFKLDRVGVGKQPWLVWALDNDRRLWQMKRASDGKISWDNDGAAGATALAVDGNGHLWVADLAGVVFRRDAASGNWARQAPTKAGGVVPIMRIAAGETHVMGIDDRKRVWYFDGTKWTEDTKTFNTRDVAFGSANRAYCANEAGEWFQGVPGTWGAAKGKLTGLYRLEAGFDDAVCCLGPKTGNDYTVQDHTGTAFAADSKGGKGIDLGLRARDDVWVVDSGGKIWQRSSVGTWTDTPAPDYKRAKVYWVRSGDTLSEIAEGLGLKYDTLLKTGGNKARFPNPDKIEVNDRVDLP